MGKIFVLIFWCVTAIGNPGLAHQSPSPAADDLENDFHYMGLLECAECHITSTAVDRFKKTTDFVFKNEFRNWLNDDPHARAYLSIVPDRKHFDAIQTKLTEFQKFVDEETVRHTGQQLPPAVIPQWEESSNNRSLNILIRVSGSTETEIANLFQQMSDQPDLLVKADVVNEHSSKLVATVKQCMSCHAGWDIRINEFDFDVVRYGTGVSCEGCHGPASKWSRAHADSKWRTMAPMTKAIDHGLSNIRNPIARSKLCFSCHIGDVDQGRVVTHAMFAAGHPPLPSIEIESFADQIPRHWRYLSEKKPGFEFADEFRDLLAADFGLASRNQVEQDYARTKNLLVSGVMASALSVDLLAKSAGEYLKLQSGTSIHSPKTDLNPWPDYAAFNCTACHHDLKAAGRERAFAGVPGRPPAPDWPRTLSKLGLAWLETRHEAGFMDEFLEKQHGLQDALNRQPFGSPEELCTAGSAYSDFLTRMATQIQSTPMTRDNAIIVLKLLSGAEQNSIFNPEAESWDFHSARQIGWAIQLVSSELTQQRNSGLQHLSGDVVALERDLAEALSEIQDYLMLELAATGEITPLQPKLLNVWRDFDRNRFLEMIERFSVALRSSELAIKDRQP